jgi:hypothetical protein
MTASTFITFASWTVSGIVLGLVVALGLLSSGGSAPGMCGNAILEPGVAVGGVLGLTSGCVLALLRGWRAGG